MIKVDNPHRSYSDKRAVKGVFSEADNGSFSILLDDSSKTTIPMSRNGTRELARLLGLKE